jgi:uncharacterized protein (DUF58 family)
VALPPEILKKVKLLEITTRKLVNSMFAGQYQSAFKGQGMTFSDFREYVAGDDVRDISWTLTARAGKPYIKKYEEERELTMILAVDVSGSMGFGSKNYLKGEVITHLAALIGFAAARNNDNVGLLLFSNQIEHYVPPKKGRGHIQRILRDLYFHEPKSNLTNLSVVSDYLSQVLKKRATIFLMSDFSSQDEFGHSLKRLSRKHELISLVVSDDAEQALPDMGLVDFYDPETDEVMTLDTSSPLFKRLVYAEFKKNQAFKNAEFKKAQIDRIDIPNNENFVDPLLNYFRKRAH